MMKSAFIQKILLILFPLFLFFGLGAVLWIPQNSSELKEASVVAELPYGELESKWIGIKRQESEKEREVLAKDTQFNKGDYYTLDDGLIDRKRSPIHVSVVRSGKDMNSSIHRPEICLPAQGHFNLRNSSETLVLGNGKTVSFTKLDTDLNVSPDAKSASIIHGIYYYVFVGDGQIAGDHASRYMLDIKDRLLSGKVQRWAYIQIGIYYGDIIGEDKSSAEARLNEFLQFLMPQVIGWEKIH